MDVARRATGSLLIVLVGGIIALLVWRTHRPSASTITIVSMICFLLGLVALGSAFVWNAQSLFRLMFRFGLYKAQLLNSNLDTGST